MNCNTNIIVWKLMLSSSHFLISVHADVCFISFSKCYVHFLNSFCFLHCGSFIHALRIPKSSNIKLMWRLLYFVVIATIIKTREEMLFLLGSALSAISVTAKCCQTRRNKSRKGNMGGTWYFFIDVASIHQIIRRFHVKNTAKHIIRTLKEQNVIYKRPNKCNILLF